jgi:hypothetical protein
MRIVVAALLLPLIAACHRRAQATSTDTTTSAQTGLLSESHVMDTAVAMASRLMGDGASTPRDGKSSSSSAIRSD